MFTLTSNRDTKCFSFVASYPPKSFHFLIILNKMLKMAKKDVAFWASGGDKDILRLFKPFIFVIY